MALLVALSWPQYAVIAVPSTVALAAIGALGYRKRAASKRSEQQQPPPTPPAATG